MNTEVIIVPLSPGSQSGWLMRLPWKLGRPAVKVLNYIYEGYRMGACSISKVKQ